ncbi:MAG: hypothetical protein RLN67_06780, partial [Algiphilus sp.]
AATDHVRAYVEQIRPFVDRNLCALGTDGYGRSDTRNRLRDYFEMDRRWITVRALKALADEGAIPKTKVTQAMRIFGIMSD